MSIRCKLGWHKWVEFGTLVEEDTPLFGETTVKEHRLKYCPRCDTFNFGSVHALYDLSLDQREQVVEMMQSIRDRYKTR